MSDPHRDLDRLLDVEHNALLMGDYVVLAELSSRKFELLERDDIFAVSEQSAELRRKLDRNQTLLAMAISGFRSARGDIDAIKGQRGGFQAYDKHGGRNVVGGTSSGFERKV